ncbi:hypothetical protein [Erythrobacter crassostreae]|uniref:S-adenosyl-L-homocysteine hydrolase n=1 Tax=Erythrobacter crassostreae TaxID=2828328 RepID=A0A9X1F3T5_9SPHN|nr:hypothetical protein [Erythrobacter crassostrea]MBV7259771.1 hypothetical protein [Erythrobacter crassostrea]
MRVSKTFGAGIAALALLMPGGAGAQELDQAYIGPIAANAENIRSLNIMLMVTSLRCRKSAHDFRGEYDMFSRKHQQNLAEPHTHLSRNLVVSYGEDGTARALDKTGVTIANRYGDGHPTLKCADLKRATFDLARSQDRMRLSNMADALLEGWAYQDRPTTTALALVAGETAKPALEYEAQLMNESNPTRTNGSVPEKVPASKVPIWLRG